MYFLLQAVLGKYTNDSKTTRDYQIKTNQKFFQVAHLTATCSQVTPREQRVDPQTALNQSPLQKTVIYREGPLRVNHFRSEDARVSSTVRETRSLIS